MAEQPQRASIVSGYFNPFHQGHLDLFEQARERTGYLSWWSTTTRSSG